MSEKSETIAKAVFAPEPGSTAAGQASEPAMEYVRQAMAGMQFGQVAIIVQDGVVVQVERTERRRFRRGENRIEQR